MIFDEYRIKAIWNQEDIPVVLRRGGLGDRPRLRLPYADDNRQWLRNDRRDPPVWKNDLRCWEIPKAWFNDFVARGLKRYGRLYVIQPYREQEKCAPACMRATGHECECSCMGANHGSNGGAGWFEVSDTFATCWGERHLACRLMTAKTAVHF